MGTGLPWWLSGKESTCQHRRHGFNFWSREIPHAFEELNSCAEMRGGEKKKKRIRLEKPESNTDTDICGYVTSDQAPWTYGSERTITLGKNLENGRKPP